MEDLIASEEPDVLLLQEHWLTPVELCLFDSRFTNYFSFGCSTMASRVDAGVLRGRPYGGVMTLIKKDLRNVTTTIHCEERFVVIKVIKVKPLLKLLSARTPVKRDEPWPEVAKI